MIPRISTDPTSHIGGALANPAEQYQAFRDVPLFRDHAYALPGFVSGAFCLSTAIVSTVFLNEVRQNSGASFHLRSLASKLTSSADTPKSLAHKGKNAI